MKNQKICVRCVSDMSIPNITFDEEGVCNFCKIHEELEAQYPLNELGKQKLDQILEKIKNNGKNKKYNCIVGVSGGTDSSYLLYKTHNLGLRPLAVHFDCGWNSDIAVTNIKNITSKLDVDLYTYVVDWEEFKNLQISFLNASVSDAEIPTDVGIHATLLKVAAEENIKYVINGHSFRNESMMPIGWTYMDGKYINSVQRKFSKKKLRTFPNVTFSNFFYYSYLKGIKVIPLLNYFQYNKTHAKKILKKELGWIDYGGHHHESYYTHFFQSYLLPKKFHIDKRITEFSAFIRSGQMIRKNALTELRKNPYPYEEDLVNYTISKLDITREEFDSILNQPIKSFHDYPTYYPLIKAFRIPIKMATKLKLIPYVLYQKFFN